VLQAIEQQLIVVFIGRLRTCEACGIHTRFAAKLIDFEPRILGDQKGVAMLWRNVCSIVQRLENGVFLKRHPGFFGRIDDAQTRQRNNFEIGAAGSSKFGQLAFIGSRTKERQGIALEDGDDRANVSRSSNYYESLRFSERCLLRRDQFADALARERDHFRHLRIIESGVFGSSLHFDELALAC